MNFLSEAVNTGISRKSYKDCFVYHDTVGLKCGDMVAIYDRGWVFSMVKVNYRDEKSRYKDKKVNDVDYPVGIVRDKNGSIYVKTYGGGKYKVPDEYVVYKTFENEEVIVANVLTEMEIREESVVYDCIGFFGMSAKSKRGFFYNVEGLMKDFDVVDLSIVLSKDTEKTSPGWSSGFYTKQAIDVTDDGRGLMQPLVHDLEVIEDEIMTASNTLRIIEQATMTEEYSKLELKMLVELEKLRREKEELNRKFDEYMKEKENRDVYSRKKTRNNRPFIEKIEAVKAEPEFTWTKEMKESKPELFLIEQLRWERENGVKRDLRCVIEQKPKVQEPVKQVIYAKVKDENE